MGEAFRIVIEGQEAYEAALKQAQREAFKAAQAAIRKVGKPVVALARAHAPRKSGKLAAGLRIRVRGLTGEIVGSRPYSAGAEWGKAGKWSGFTKHYGAPPRYGWKAVEESSEEIARGIEKEMTEVVSVFGWFR